MVEYITHLQYLKIPTRCYACFFFFMIENARYSNLPFMLGAIFNDLDLWRLYWNGTSLMSLGFTFHILEFICFVKDSIMPATCWFCPFFMITSIYWINVLFYTSTIPWLTHHMLWSHCLWSWGSLQHPSGFCRGQTCEWNGDIMETLSSSFFRSLLLH